MLGFHRDKPSPKPERRVVIGMYISVPTNQLRTVEAILRDHNMHPIEGKLPVVGGTQLVNIRDDQVAKNVLQRLKAAGITASVTSTV
jgi:hypothetical protein